MGLLTYSYTLVAGTAENINNVQTMFDQLRTLVNGNLDSSNLADNAVGTSELQANAVTAAKIEAQQAWQTLALSGTGINGATSAVYYYKDSLGVVHIRPDSQVVVTSSATIAAGQILGTLPAGYRPGTNSHMTMWPTFNIPTPPTQQALYIDSTGNIKALSGWTVGASGVSYMIGQGASFRAEN